MKEQNHAIHHHHHQTNTQPQPRGRVGVGSDGGVSGAIFSWSRYQQQPPLLSFLPMEREEFRVQSHTILHNKSYVYTRARAHTHAHARTRARTHNYTTSRHEPHPPRLLQTHGERRVRRTGPAPGGKTRSTSSAWRISLRIADPRWPDTAVQSCMRRRSSITTATGSGGRQCNDGRHQCNDGDQPDQR